jgi:hypothetical protein
LLETRTAVKHRAVISSSSADADIFPDSSKGPLRTTPTSSELLPGSRPRQAGPDALHRAMIEDMPEIREQLTNHWQTAALDLVRRGFRPEAVFETLLTVGLAGHVEIHGKETTADKLVAVAGKLSEQVRTEMAAAEEAKGSTKN